MASRLIGLTLAAFVAATSAISAETACNALADDIVETAARGVLSDAVKEIPELKKMDGNELAAAAGKIFITGDRPDFKAYGYMMLLWYGGEEGRTLVAKAGPDLKTEKDRAHYYFVVGLFQLRSKNAETAATGRDYIRQMRDSGKVAFVPDAMWKQLIDTCMLPS